MFRARPCPFHAAGQQPEEELPIDEGGEGLSSDNTMGGASPSNAAWICECDGACGVFSVGRRTGAVEFSWGGDERISRRENK